MEKNLSGLVGEVKQAGLDIVVKGYKTTATSKDKAGVEHIAEAECFQVVIKDMPIVEGMLNDTLYRKAYLVALGAARAEFTNADGTSARKSRKTLTPVTE